MYKTISILGTIYTIMLDCSEEDMPEEADGCMDQSTKTIKIAKMISDRNQIQNLNLYRNKVLRHEIVHAMLSRRDSHEYNE